MSDDEVAPFEQEPTTITQAMEQLHAAINATNTAINMQAGFPASVVAHFAVVIDERSFTDVGVVAGVSVLEPSGQPEWLTRGLLGAAVDQCAFAPVYDEEDDE